MKTKTKTEGTALKVLVLEDSPRDLELMRELLLNADYHLDLTHVENKASFTNALHENTFDLILSDFKLPGFDAFGALEISRELCPETPFICVSGTIGEETAVELLKLGAVDYVLKDKPDKLPLAVNRALEEAKAKVDYQKALEGLRESEEKMRSIYRVAPTGIGVVEDRVLKEVNPRICEMTGYSRDELIGRNARILYPSQEEYEFVGKVKYDQIREKGTGEVETRWQKKDGSMINVLLSSTSIELNDHSKGITFTVLDITERKKAEEALRLSEKHNAFLARTAFELVELTSIQEIYKYTVQKLYELFEGNSIVSLMEYNYNENRWKMQQIEGVGKKASDLSRLLGFDIRTLEGDISTKYYEQITSGKVTELEIDFPGLFNNKLSAAIGSAVKKMFSIEKMYCIAYQQDDQIIGNITFTTSKKSELIYASLIESFIQQVSNFVKKQKAEELLKESEENFRSLIESSNDGICLQDMQGKIIFANKRKHEMLGYKNEEQLLGTNVFDLLKESDQQRFKELTPLFMEKGFLTNIEAEVIKYDGSLLAVDLNFRLIKENNGDPRYIMDTMRDVTERKRAESIRHLQYNIARATITSKNLNELFDSVKNELNNIIDARNFVIASYNEETGMLSANVDRDEKDEIKEWPAEKSITGYLIRQNRPMLLRKNEILHLHEEKIIDLHGTVSEAWLGVPLKREGEVFGAVVVQNYDNPDVYDQTSIEIMELVAHELSMFIDWQGAKEKANKLSRAVEQSSVSVLITNREGLIEYVNPFFTELTGFGLEEVKGKNPNILKSGHQSTAFYQELWDTILSGNDWEGEMLNKKKNGNLFWEKAIISPILSNDGVITNFVAIKEDITEDKKMLEELMAAKEKAEESDRLKTAFLNNMSHEIRTPLNGILGFTSLINEPDTAPGERDYYSRIIYQSGQQLLSIIDNMVNIATIEAGQEKLNETKTNLKEIFDTLYMQFVKRVDDTRVMMNYRINLSDEQASIIADDVKVRQILANLVGNAVKFTEKGMIEFTCNLKNDFLFFSVTDTGIGIPEIYHELIFERFRQVDHGPDRLSDGNGLGLAISKAYVELMGGEIWVESEPEKGSTFYFTIPYKPVTHIRPLNNEKENKPQLNVAALKAKTILLAEDEFSNSMLVEIILKPYGINLIHVTNGKDAVEAFRKNTGIDLVLMDLKMPVMNGFEATKIIKKEKPDLPVIAITAYALAGDREKALKAGCDDYIGKPVKKNDLLAIIKKYS